MSIASFDLSHIRGWACDTLSASDAGRLCGMLSEVSRHVYGLEAENAKLRELAVEQRRLADAIHAYWADGLNQEQFDVLMKATAKVNRLFEELGIEV